MFLNSTRSSWQTSRTCSPNSQALSAHSNRAHHHSRVRDNASLSPLLPTPVRHGSIRQGHVRLLCVCDTHVTHAQRPISRSSARITDAVVLEGASTSSARPIPRPVHLDFAPPRATSYALGVTLRHRPHVFVVTRGKDETFTTSTGRVRAGCAVCVCARVCVCVCAGCLI